ncbi:MAG: RHS repeat-associated core domain-containing protein, partial [Acidobacteriota bacterium]
MHSRPILGVLFSLMQSARKVRPGVRHTIRPVPLLGCLVAGWLVPVGAFPQCTDPDSTPEVLFHDGTAQEGSSDCDGTGGQPGAGGVVLTTPPTDPLLTILKSPDQEPFRNPDIGELGVVLSSGEFVYQTTDLRIPGRGFDFAFTRTYRSRNEIETTLGRGWNFNYNERMMVDGPSVPIQWVRGDSWTSTLVHDTSASGDYISLVGFAGLAKNTPEGVQLRLPDGTIRQYAKESGQLLKITDRAGNSMSFFYDASARLSYVIDTMGRRIDFFYETTGSGRLVAVEDFSGRRVEFSYEGSRLTTVVVPGVVLEEGQPPQSLTTTYGYSAAIASRLSDNLTAITDRKGQTFLSMEYGVDDQAFDYDRVVRQKYGDQTPGVQEITYSYEETPTGTITRMTDRRGNGSKREYDLAGRLTRKTEVDGPLGDPGAPRQVTSYSYSSDGRLASVISPEGNETSYSYEDGFYRSNNVRTIVQRPGPRTDGHGMPSSSFVAYRQEDFEYDPIYNQLRLRRVSWGPYAIQTSEWIHRFDYEEVGCSSPERTALEDYAAYWRIDISGKQNPACDQGDLNDDGLQNAIQGNLIRKEAPAFTDPASLLDPNTVIQHPPAVSKAQFNDHGQLTTQVDPAGFVTHLLYYPEDRPANGVDLTAPPEDRVLDTTTGGYLQARVVDAVDAGLGRSQAASPPPLELETDYRYDPVGNQIQTTDPRGVVSTLLVNTFNKPLRLEPAAAIDPGRGEPGLQPIPFTKRFVYDENLNILQERQSASDTTGAFLGGAFPEVVTTYEYDLLNRPLKKSVQYGPLATNLDVTWMVYDAAENLVRTISPEGRVAEAVYDGLNRPVKVTRFAARLALPVLDPSGSPAPDPLHDDVATFTYDGNDNRTSLLRKHLAQLGGPVQWSETLSSYNGFDELARVRTPGCTLIDTYHEAPGRPVRREVSGPVGGPTPAAPSGCVEPQPLLARGTLAYDEQGRPDQSITEDYEHDPLDPFLTVPNPADDLSAVRSASYNERGLPAQVVDDKGRATTYLYDGAGRRIEVRLPQVEDPAAPGSWIDSEVTQIEYNQGDSPTRVVRAETGPGGSVRLFEESATYDALGRLLSRTVGTGSDAVTTVLERDVRGNVTRVVHPSGAETLSSYDAYDRPVKRELLLKTPAAGLDANFANPDGVITTFLEYDRDGLPTVQTDDRGQATTTTYDGIGRPIRTVHADATTWCREFSPDGNLLQEAVLPAGGGDCSQAATAPLRRLATYDAANRVIQVSTAADPSTGLLGAPVETFEYDGMGRLTYARDDNGGLHGAAETRRTYNSLGRVVKEEQTYLGLTLTVASTYLNGGLRTGLQHAGLSGMAPLRETVTPDGLGRVKSISYGAPQPFSIAYRYSGAGRVEERETSAGLVMKKTYRYDPLGRLTELDYEDATPVLLAGFQRAFDPAGRPLFEKMLHRQNGSGLDLGRLFTHDPAGRLTSVQEGGLSTDASGNATIPVPEASWSYTLDGLGNWAEYRKGQITRRTSPSAMNFYDQVDRQFDGTSWGPGRALTRDLLGNVRREEQDGFAIIYYHDAMGRLVRIERENSDLSLTRVADFAYDPLGRRIERQVTGGDRRVWVYDGWRILDELGYSSAALQSDPAAPPDRVVARTYYGTGLDEVVATDRDVNGLALGAADGVLEERLLPVTDLRGSTERILDTSGSTLERYEYTPYGEASVWRQGQSEPASAHDYTIGYTGYRTETYFSINKQLAFARYRQYDPGLGRFLERDPIGARGGPNLYAYVSDQPATATDPLGLFRVGGTDPLATGARANAWMAAVVFAASKGQTSQVRRLTRSFTATQVTQGRSSREVFADRSTNMFSSRPVDPEPTGEDMPLVLLIDQVRPLNVGMNFLPVVSKSGRLRIRPIFHEKVTIKAGKDRKKSQ